MNAIQTEVSDGTLTQVQVSLEYFEQDDLSLYLDLAETPLVSGVDYTWTTATTITLAATVAAGVTLRIQRNTDDDEMLNILDGGAAFSREVLDENFRQLLFLAQEYRDGLGLTGLQNVFDMNGFRILHVGDPVDAGDAANKEYVDAGDAVQATRNDEQDARLDTLSAGLPGTNYAMPWSTTLTEATKTVSPPYTFYSALVSLDGALQTLGQAYSVADNTITFAEGVPAGTKVFAILGQLLAPDDTASLAALSASTGAGLIGYGDGTVADVLDSITPRIDHLHKKSVVCQLPIVFPDYVTIQTAGGNSYLYPQGFYFDERANEILIAYNASGGTVYTRTIAVYNATTFVYKSCFILGLPTGAGGGESFTVTYPSAGGRYLVNKYDDVTIAYFDITTLPANRATLANTSLKTVPGVYFQVSSKGDQFMVEDTGPSIGGANTRTQFGIYDADFNRIRGFNYTKFDSGFTALADNALAPYIPKAQGVALGDGCIATVHGGVIVFNDPTSFNKYAYQGPRLYSPDGQKLAESICDPFKMRTIFEANGLPTDRFEYEGVCVTESNKILTLNLHQSRFGTQATLTGIVILREFSPEPDAIDFTSAVYTFAHPSKSTLELGLFPRSNTSLYHPVTGTQFTTLEQVLDYMDLMQVSRFSYYAPSVSLTAVSGLTVGSNALVTISNCEHLTFYVRCDASDGTRIYRVTGTSGSRAAVLVSSIVNGLTVSSTTGGVAANLTGLAATHRAILGQTGGVTRWRLSLGDSSAESGSNAGSNCVLARYTDAGAFIDAPIQVNRATGQTALTSLAVGGLSVVAGNSAINGLDLTWGATSVVVNPGSAFIPGVGIVTLTAAATINLTGLTASTFYHVYLYNGGVELVATAPVANAAGGYQKTGDSTRRYLGSVQANAATTVYRFTHSGNRMEYNVHAATFNLGGGTDTTATSISCAAAVPTTAVTVLGEAINASTAAVARIGNADLGTVSSSLYRQHVPTNTTLFLEILLVSQAFTYIFDSAPTLAFSLRVSGYTFRR